MSQLTFPNIEADILASIIRRQKNLCEELIQQIEARVVSRTDVAEKIKKIEKGLRHLCRVN